MQCFLRKFENKWGPGLSSNIHHKRSLLIYIFINLAYFTACH